MVTLKPQKPPPPDYYAENLIFLIESVVSQYSDLFSTREADLASSILQLSVDGKRLLARLAMRRVELIRVETLNYSEISDSRRTLGELSRQDMIELDPDVELWLLLDSLTIPELRGTFPDLSLRGRKAECVDMIVDTRESREILRRVRSSFHWVRLQVSEELRLFSLLFFGNLRDDYSAFVLRDLGLFKFESYEFDSKTRLFEDRRSVDTYLQMADAREFVEEQGRELEKADALEIAERFRSVRNQPILELRRSKLLNAVGRTLERNEQFAAARQVFSNSTLHPARERTVRILHREGRECERNDLLKLILGDPWSLEEEDFARSFGNRKKRKSVSFVEERQLVSQTSESIELHAIGELQADGYEAWHFENGFPMGLFGLAYWEWIFAPSLGAFVNSFQSAPIDLFEPDFFDRRRQLCIDPLASPGTLKCTITRKIDQKFGINNALVDWRICNSAAFRKCLDVVKVEVLRSVLQVISRDLRQMRSGFPDLTAIDSQGNIEFIEVKGPTDQVQRNQAIWIRELERVNVPVKVIRYSAQ